MILDFRVENPALRRIFDFQFSILNPAVKSILDFEFQIQIWQGFGILILNLFPPNFAKPW